MRASQFLPGTRQRGTFAEAVFVKWFALGATDERKIRAPHGGKRPFQPVENRDADLDCIAAIYLKITTPGVCLNI